MLPGPFLCSPSAVLLPPGVYLTLLAVLYFSIRRLLGFCGMYARPPVVSCFLRLFLYSVSVLNSGVSQGCWETGRMSAVLKYKRDL